MKIGILVLVLLLAVLPASAACAAQAPLSIAEYRAELQRFQESASALRESSQASQLLSAVPLSCTVAVPGGSMEVSFTWMRAALTEVQRHPESLPSKVAEISERLAMMQAAALAYDQPAATADARSRLTDILARREFRQVKQPGLLDVWRDRALFALARLIDWVFSRVHISRSASTMIMWAVIAALFALLLWIVFRTVWRDRRPPAIPPLAEVVRRSAPDWLRMAREAAARGAYREAIHHSYWAAVARLEEGGAWRPDRARTPREYLRVLPRAHTGWPPLAALTQRFERAWYGSRAVTEPEYAEAVGELEKLGCRSS